MMIRTIRKVLMAVISCRLITDDVLSAVFCEVEHLVNERPLTKCSSDALDEAALTSNHCLLLEGNYPSAWRPFCGGEVYRKSWKRAQNIIGSFWKRSQREYLPELQRRQKWRKDTMNYRVGDLVLVIYEQLPREQWPQALVK